MRISRFELARKPVPCFLPAGECLRDAFPVPVELIPAPVAVVVAMTRRSKLQASIWGRVPGAEVKIFLGMLASS